MILKNAQNYQLLNKSFNVLKIYARNHKLSAKLSKNLKI